MDFNLVLCIILGVLLCFVVPIACYIFAKDKPLNKIRNLLLVFYIIALFVGVTAEVTIDNNLVHINYNFTKIWGNKEMFWGFENLTLLNVALNLVMLIPLGAYLASSKNNLKWWQTILLACLAGMLCSLIIETLQFILPVDRVVEFSDTVFNTISCGLGALMIVVFKKLRNKVQSKFKKEESDD